MDLFATDKVALIVSNCSYRHLPELVTPLCDAETLAQVISFTKEKSKSLGSTRSQIQNGDTSRFDFR